MNTKAVVPILIASAAMAWFVSCASTGRSAAVKLEAESSGHFEAARYQEGLDVFRKARTDHPDDKAIATSYSKALSRVFAAGETASKKGDHAAAERIYVLLQRNIHGDEPVVPPPAFTRAVLDSRIKSSGIAIAVGRIERSLMAGEYQRAIDGCRELIKNHPRDPAAMSKAVSAFESVQAAGAASLDRKDFASAGIAYYALKNGLPAFSRGDHPPSLGRAEIDACLATCRTELTRRGLDLYRRADLRGAISVWKKLLLFDPDNIQIKKSIESATAQMNRFESSGQ